jgi:hypothetical protein
VATELLQLGRRLCIGVSFECLLSQGGSWCWFGFHQLFDRHGCAGCCVLSARVPSSQIHAQGRWCKVASRQEAKFVKISAASWSSFAYSALVGLCPRFNNAHAAANWAEPNPKQEPNWIRVISVATLANNLSRCVRGKASPGVGG